MKIFNKGFNYSQDGPGNRLVYHLQGCNFRCKWCSNPESMDCVGKSKEYSIDELVKEAVSCQPMYFDGGGVTLTGGEPTVQFSEAEQLLTQLKEVGIHTAIENNGSHPQLERLFDVIDFLIMDFKHYDNGLHKKWTGADNTQTLKNLIKISECKRQALIRIPVINGINSSPDGFIKLFRELNCDNISFEILSYHEFGKEKWTTPYEIENGFVSKESFASFKKAFTDNGLKIIET